MATRTRDEWLGKLRERASESDGIVRIWGHEVNLVDTEEVRLALLWINLDWQIMFTADLSDPDGSPHKELIKLGWTPPADG